MALRQRARAAKKKHLRNERGSALLMAIFTVMVLTAIAMEISYQTMVEARISSQSVHQLKAYYAAKSAAELGIFRVFLFRKAVAQFGEMIPDKTMLDLIWNFPFAWPPPVPEDTNAVDKDSIQKVVSESLMKAQYSLNIESEGAKIDINDLGSPSKAIAKAAHDQIMQMFKSRLEGEDAFAEKYRNFDFERLLNNVADWVDENTESRNGGDEKAAYASIRNDYIPPNQPFKTIGELHMVADMTDEIFDVLAPRLTVYGSKGINVRYATKEVLMSLSPQITDVIAAKIIEARNDPQKQDYFKDQKSFIGLINELGISGDPFTSRDNEPTVPLIFDAEYNFRIKVAGKSGPVIREIMAVTYDFDQVKNRLGEALQKQADKEKGQSGTSSEKTEEEKRKEEEAAKAAPPGSPGKTPGATKPKIKVPKERPTVVYWVE